MSSKTIYTSISNSTSFLNPQFVKTAGNGGQGATGEVSDGGVIFCMDRFGWSCSVTGADPNHYRLTVGCSGVDSTGKFKVNTEYQTSVGGTPSCSSDSIHVRICRNMLIGELKKLAGVDVVIEKSCNTEAA